MAHRTLLSLDVELKNEADKYIKTHKDVRTFSKLVAQALRDYIHLEERMQKISEEEKVKMLLVKQSLLAWRNLCEDILVTMETNPQTFTQKADHWKEMIEQLNELSAVFNTLHNK